MSRTRVTVTTSWQEVNASTACVVTIDRVAKKGGIFFNDSSGAADTQLALYPKPNWQIEQDEDKPLFVRADEDGWEIVVDTKG